MITADKFPESRIQSRLMVIKAIFCPV